MKLYLCRGVVQNEHAIGHVVRRQMISEVNDAIRIVTEMQNCAMMNRQAAIGSQISPSHVKELVVTTAVRRHIRMAVQRSDANEVTVATKAGHRVEVEIRKSENQSQTIDDSRCAKQKGTINLTRPTEMVAIKINERNEMTTREGKAEPRQNATVQ